MSSGRIISDGVYIDKLREVVSTNLGGRSEEPAQLLNHLWLGSQRNAESLRQLRKIGVTHVLNCAGFKGPRENPDANPYEGLDIEYKEFKADDEDSYDVTQHFREAFNYIDKVQRMGGVCLIHCALGINRSGAISTAYLMMHNSWPLLKTVDFIKQRRRVILSNAGFRRQLVRFARMKGLLDPLNDEEYEEDVKKFTRKLNYGSHVNDTHEEDVKNYMRRHNYGSYADDTSEEDVKKYIRRPNHGSYADDTPEEDVRAYIRRLNYGSYADDTLRKRPSRSLDRDLYRGPRSSSLSSFSTYKSRDSAPPSTDYQRGDACLEFLYNRFINREKKY